MSLPLIDLSLLTSSDPNAQAAEIKHLDHACREIGFIYLVNTGISLQLMQRVFSVAKQFFALPQDQKEKIDIGASPNHRGYGSIGEEKLEDGVVSDWKETFDMALDLPLDHEMVGKYPKMYGPNRYPDDNTFVDTLDEYYQAAFSASQALLMAMAKALQLESDFFTRSFNTHVTVLRLIHYPPRPSVDHDNGAGAHTDYGCVTLLLQDQVGGLQVKARNGEWIDAPPVEGALVVNIGDLMQRWTNDQYISTAHRVRASMPGMHRYSVPFFVEPDYETLVACLPSCQSDQQPAKYGPIYSGDWIQSRLDATYSYRQSE